MQETFEKLLSSLRNWPLNHFSTPTGREGGTKVVRYKRRQIGLLKARSTRCLKITEKVSFNIASEASYVYILSGQKLIKDAPKMVHFGEFMKT